MDRKSRFRNTHATQRHCSSVLLYFEDASTGKKWNRNHNNNDEKVGKNRRIRESASSWLVFLLFYTLCLSHAIIFIIVVVVVAISFASNITPSATVTNVGGECQKGHGECKRHDYSNNNMRHKNSNSDSDSRAAARHPFFTSTGKRLSSKGEQRGATRATTTTTTTTSTSSSGQNETTETALMVHPSAKASWRKLWESKNHPQANEERLVEESFR